MKMKMVVCPDCRKTRTVRSTSTAKTCAPCFYKRRNPNAWIKRVGNTAICISCKKDVSSIPGRYCRKRKQHLACHLAKRQRLKEIETAQRHRWGQKQRVVDMLGGACVRCGMTDIRVLQFNHINGGGTREREVLTYFAFLRAAIAGNYDLNKIDLRCANCNVIFEYEQGRRRLPKTWRQG
jgi:hypothetical protein